MKSVEEADVGITCYISELPGFRGILKQRYSDFIVNEVDCDQNIVHLTSLDAPPEVKEKDEIEAPHSDQSDKSYTSELELFRTLANEPDVACLKALIDQLNSGAEDSVSPIVLSPNSDKSHRTTVHNFFKEKLKFLVTDTIDGPDASSKCIRVRLNSRGNSTTRGNNSKKRKGRNDIPFDGRGSDHWPEGTGKFLRFHLYKENKDTQEALGVLGKMLGVLPRSFGFSGTKDKRSVSTQRVTVFKQHAGRLSALNDRLIGIKVGDFCYVNEGLLLGQLLGNRFTITLRGVADTENTIKASADALGKHGFINYFGLQRFGSGSVPTHLIGAALIRGEWDAAVRMILGPREGERDAIREAREYFKDSNDIEGTLKRLPRKMVAERAILQSLNKYPGNSLQALQAIPRTLRMMYVHSYQSYLWNHAASMRLQKYGMGGVVLGDLVYCTKSSSENISRAAISGCEEASCDAFNDSTYQDENSEEKNIIVKAVNEEDLATGELTVYDVILPLPGSRVIYPANDVSRIYHELAKKDLISLTESVHNVKEFSITNMTGGYRRVFQKPKDFEWELVLYKDENEPLAETDLDKITYSNPVNIRREDPPFNGNVDKSVDLESLKSDARLSRDHDAPEGDKGRSPQDDPGYNFAEAVNSGVLESLMAVKLAFTLPASSYATMAIRELLKTSTSVAFHKTLKF